MSLVYRCDICHMAEQREPVPSPVVGTDDDSARAAGWRIGATKSNPRNIICPECAGTDVAYWDRKVLSAADQAGLRGVLSGHPDDQGREL